MEKIGGCFVSQHQILLKSQKYSKNEYLARVHLMHSCFMYIGLGFRFVPFQLPRIGVFPHDVVIEFRRRGVAPVQQQVQIARASRPIESLFTGSGIAQDRFGEERRRHGVTANRRIYRGHFTNNIIKHYFKGFQ